MWDAVLQLLGVAGRPGRRQLPVTGDHSRVSASAALGVPCSSLSPPPHSSVWDCALPHVPLFRPGEKAGTHPGGAQDLLCQRAHLPAVAADQVGRRSWLRAGLAAWVGSKGRLCAWSSRHCTLLLLMLLLRASTLHPCSVLILMTATSMLSGSGLLSGLTGGGSGASCDSSDKACFASKVGWGRADECGLFMCRVSAEDAVEHAALCCALLCRAVAAPWQASGRVNPSVPDVESNDHRACPRTLYPAAAAVGRHHHPRGPGVYGICALPVPPAHAPGGLVGAANMPKRLCAVWLSNAQSGWLIKPWRLPLMASGCS